MGLRAGSGPAKKNQLKPQKLVKFIFHLLFRKLENLDKKKLFEFIMGHTNFNHPVSTFF